MADSESEKNNTISKSFVIKIASGIVAVLGMITAVITFDSRYSNDPVIAAFEKQTNAIVLEMRREIGFNRSAMLSNMLREADDIEFQLTGYEMRDETAPRYLVEKHRQILRDIEELKSHETPE